jgi:hypothetical protein
MKTLKDMAALAAPLLVLTLSITGPTGECRSGGQGPTVTGAGTPTAEQLQSLVARTIDNQHRNDRALEEYERLEHVVSRKDENAGAVSDRTERLFPSGTGTIHLQTAQSTPPVSPDIHRRQLQYTVSALEQYLHPNDHVRQDVAKFEKRRRERADLVDAMAQAFHITWAGRETRGSRTLAKLILDPDPNFKPASRVAAAFEHVHAVLWVDEAQAQAARLEIEIISDITFGGGIVAKLYRGGHFVMEQSEVSPGVWLPTTYTYDVDGRKFLMGFNVHENTELTHYRHVGPPSQSIDIIRNELNDLTAETPVR